MFPFAVRWPSRGPLAPWPKNARPFRAPFKAVVRSGAKPPDSQDAGMPRGCHRAFRNGAPTGSCVRARRTFARSPSGAGLVPLSIQSLCGLSDAWLSTSFRSRGSAASPTPCRQAASRTSSAVGLASRSRAVELWRASLRCVLASCTLSPVISTASGDAVRMPAGRRLHEG